MTKEFFERLDKYMVHKGLNDHRLTLETGIAIGIIGRQRKKGRYLSMENIEKLLLVYTDLNAGWLIAGTGNMLNDDINNEEDNIDENDEEEQNCEHNEEEHTYINNEECIENNKVSEDEFQYKTRKEDDNIFLREIVVTMQNTITSQQSTIATLTSIIERNLK